MNCAGLFSRPDAFSIRISQKPLFDGGFPSKSRGFLYIFLQYCLCLAKLQLFSSTQISFFNVFLWEINASIDIKHTSNT